MFKSEYIILIFSNIGVNPFTAISRSLTEIGQYGKIIGPKDLFCSCFEISEGINMSNCTPTTSNPSSSISKDVNVTTRRTVSLIHPPTSIMNSVKTIDDGDSEEDKT